MVKCLFHIALLDLNQQKTHFFFFFFFPSSFADHEGCVRGRHRDKHHHDFPYSAYFQWMNQEESNEEKTLLEVTQEDLEDEFDKTASFGVRTDGNYFVKLAKGHFKLFLAIFSAEDLQKLTSSSESVIVATRGSDKLPDEFDASTPELRWHTTASWVFKDAKVCGVTLTVKSLTRTTPNSKSAFFNPATLPALSDTKVTHDDTVPLAQKPTLPNFQVEPKVEKFTAFPKEIGQGWFPVFLLFLPFDSSPVCSRHSLWPNSEDSE